MTRNSKLNETRVATLMTFDTVGEAEVIRALLESAGVHALVQNDILAGMFPTGSMLKVRLYVLEDDLPKAREVLGAKYDTLPTE